MKLKEKQSKQEKAMLTQSELNEEIIKALCKKFGVSNAMRFVNQFRQRKGNYAEERKKMFERLTLDQIKRELKQLKKGSFLK